MRRCCLDASAPDEGSVENGVRRRLRDSRALDQGQALIKGHRMPAAAEHDFLPPSGRGSSLNLLFVPAKDGLLRTGKGTDYQHRQSEDQQLITEGLHASDHQEHNDSRHDCQAQLLTGAKSEMRMPGRRLAERRSASLSTAGWMAGRCH
jgi:hypothetical protein